MCPQPVILNVDICKLILRAQQTCGRRGITVTVWGSFPVVVLDTFYWGGGGGGLIGGAP